MLNLLDILLICTLALCLGLAVRSAARARRAGKSCLGCSGSCAACPGGCQRQAGRERP